MALTYIGKTAVPMYSALTTDIESGGNIVGANNVGGTIYFINNNSWGIVNPDLTIGSYFLPISINGEITSNENVNIIQDSPGVSNGVVVAKSVAGSDSVSNNVSKLIAPGTTTDAPLAVVPLLFNGTTFDRLPGDKTNGEKVNVTNSTLNVTGSAVTVTSGNIAVTGTVGVSGTVNASGSAVTVSSGTVNATISGAASTILGNVGFIDSSNVAHGYVYYDSSPQIVSLPYSYAIAHGNVPNHTAFQKIGYQPASGSGSRTVWNYAGEYVFPLANQQMEVVSTDNTNDKTAGNGALTVKIYYLNSSFVEKTTTVTMNGTAAVLTTATDIYRINAFRIATAGSSGVAAGTISLRNSTDHTTIYDQIAIGMTESRSMVYTVPTGKDLYIANIYFSAGSGDAFDRVTFTARATYDSLAGALTSNNIFLPYSEYILQNNLINVDLQVPLKFPTGTDFKISVSGNSGAVCSCGIRGWLDAG